MKKTITITFFLVTSIIYAQIVNFDIDNDTSVNGPIISQTVVQNNNTYVLTAISSIPSSNASILNFNGGGQFRLDFNDVETSNWEISITENGIPIDFTLVSLDYLILAAGVYNLTNNSGAIITGDTVLNQGGSTGTFTIDNQANALAISSFNINGITLDALAEVAFHNITIDLDRTLSILENEFTNIKIFPNPASTELNIDTGSNFVKKVSIYDTTGKIVLKITTDRKVDLSRLISGMYYLQIEEENKKALYKILVN